MSYEEYVSENRAKSAVTSDPLSEGTVASLARELRTTYALRAELESELAQAASARQEALAQADVTISQAQIVASSLVSIATDEAAQIRRDAQAQAQTIREAAERDARAICDKAFEEASAANAARIDGLERVAAELRRAMESTFNSLDLIDGELAGESDAAREPRALALPEVTRPPKAGAQPEVAAEPEAAVAPEPTVADVESAERLVDRRHKRLGPVERDGDLLTRQRGWRK